MVTAPAVALVLADDAGCRRIRTARHHPSGSYVRITGLSAGLGTVNKTPAGRGIRPAGAGEPFCVYGF
jgi:hypothetical protein